MDIVNNKESTCSLADDHKVAAYLLSEIRDHENVVQQLDTEVATRKNIVEKQQCHIDELFQLNANIENEKEKLTQIIKQRRKLDDVQKLREILELVKDLERKESELRAVCEEADAEVAACNLENEDAVADKAQCGDVNYDHALKSSLNRLTSAKVDLAAKLRAILALKRKIGDVPTQSELIQYERRISELNAEIQKKHQLTRKLYATYNTLLEIKELMTKETSLLNSINTQFQEAMRSSTGRSKLLDSMDAIVTGSQQKLDRVEVNLLAEKIHCDSLKEKYAAAVAELHQFSSLLKVFQDECARNEQLRHLGSCIKMSDNL